MSFFIIQSIPELYEGRSCLREQVALKVYRYLSLARENKFNCRRMHNYNQAQK